MVERKWTALIKKCDVLMSSLDRYWGESSPYQVLTAETLQLLTIDQAIQDFIRFAQKAKLPFDKNGKSNAKNAPWVMVGGSYSANLAAWTESIAPGTFCKLFSFLF